MPKVESITTPKSDWYRVRDAARRTALKAPLGESVAVSNKFKRKILLAEHSPIRCLEYDIVLTELQQWVTTHLVRHHIGVEKFVATQRIDRNEEVARLARLIRDALTSVARDLPDEDALKDLIESMTSDRDAVPQGLRNNMMISANAQALMNISRKRLCKGCTSSETRAIWECIINDLAKIDPILAEKCVPECVYRGFCPEFDRCCGYVNTNAYKQAVEEYRRYDND